MPAKVLPFTELPVPRDERITVIALRGDEYAGAPTNAFAIFGPISADADYPVPALLRDPDGLFIECAAPHGEGVLLADGTLLARAAMVGLLFDVATTRAQAMGALRRLEGGLAALDARLASLPPL
jgi:hypothetical protein